MKQPIKYKLFTQFNKGIRSIWEPINLTFSWRKWYVKYYPYVISKSVVRLSHFHLGYDDRSLFWMINGRIYDLFFFKIR